MALAKIQTLIKTDIMATESTEEHEKINSL